MLPIMSTISVFNGRKWFIWMHLPLYHPLYHSWNHPRFHYCIASLVPFDHPLNHYSIRCTNLPSIRPFYILPSNTILPSMMLLHHPLYHSTINPIIKASMVPCYHQLYQYSIHYTIHGTIQYTVTVSIALSCKQFCHYSIRCTILPSSHHSIH